MDTEGQKFKDFVHNFLDEMGVPTHPPGVHLDAGCRIGQRLQWLKETHTLPQNELSQSKELREAVEKYIKNHEHTCQWVKQLQRTVGLGNRNKLRPPGVTVEVTVQKVVQGDQSTYCPYHCDDFDCFVFGRYGWVAFAPHFQDENSGVDYTHWIKVPRCHVQ